MRTFLAGAVVPWRCKGRRGAYASGRYPRAMKGRAGHRLLYRHGVLAMKRPGQIHGAHEGTRRKSIKPRRCLHCSRKFLSFSSGNSLCSRCRELKWVKGLQGSTTMTKKREYKFKDRPYGCVTPSEAGVLVGVTGQAIKYRIRIGKLKATRSASDIFWIRKSDLKAQAFRNSNTQAKKAKRKRRKPRFNRAEAKKFGFRIEKALPKWKR